jgi:NAD(P)-dependent dehydrogenase (short-subunit alcohol dehydrogenase family)
LDGPKPALSNPRTRKTDEMMDKELRAKHAVVTGGGKGIGEAIARYLANAGAAVTIMGRDAGALGNVATEIGAQPITVDLLDHGAAHQAFADAAKIAGPIDILINNVGAERSAKFEKTTRADWDSMLAVNMTVAFTCIQAVLPDMKRRGSGRVVNVASTASLKGEVAKTGVTVNAVCPGFTETELLERSLQTIVAATGRTDEDARSELMKGNPQGRFIQPDEVAAAVGWLCSEAASSVTGQAICISGGEI